MLRIVHLSDIHLAHENIKDFDNFVIKALMNDLEEFHAAKKIDMIILSGDLIDKGGLSFEDINSAFIIFKEKVIDAISEKIKLSCNQIFIIPGNHDIERNADDEIDEAGLYSVLRDTTKVNKMIESGKTKGIKRIIPYKKFEAELYKEFKGTHRLTNYQSCFKLEIDSLTVGISCFNTAWRCYDSKTDKGNIILGEMQITDAREILGDCDLKIGVVHHASDWLAAFESKDIESLIDRDYDMLFCGHIHDGSAWSRTNLYGTLFVSIAPTNWSYNIRKKEIFCNNGYAIIDYDFTSRKITVHNRRYSFKKECYDPNTELGDERGVFECTLPSSSETAIRNTEIQLMLNIKNSFFDVVNEHLLTYDTDTKAPKDIDGIFVLPRIVENINYDVEEEKKENVFNLEDMYGSTDNIVLFGAKESGKTILLDKILKDLTNNIQTYHISPVLFDFNEVGNKRYETIISSVLGMSIHDVGDYLKNNKVILLIDNLSFNELDKYRLKNLETLINSYPKIRILATCGQTIQGNIIPLEMLKYETFHFRMLTIESFRTKQIRELILKWFSNQTDFDIVDKVEKLVNFVLSLNLPRTPLAISMLLWIIEQQENYKPINNATMLENFIERLFKKLSKHEIYSYEFDYRNKERLLADIAFEMYRNGTENYRIKYIDL
jgi:predicted MPP superfamily phosphohydrolase